MVPNFLDRTKLVHKSGVYIFRGESRNVLYVGKAIDLKSRISQYFNPSAEERTKSLVRQIKFLDTIVVESELEALILEANLIKKHLPPFNIRLTDSRDYLYIIVTKEEYPKIIAGRFKDVKGAKAYFGPFPSAKTVRETLKNLRKIFPWCSAYRCGNINPPPGWDFRPCFYYHLGLCPGPCAGKIPAKEYNKIIKRFIKFMDGKKEQVVKELTKEMEGLARQRNFEQAARIKKIIEGILYLTQANRTKLYLENPNFLQQENQQSLECLKKDLGLKKLPERIEGYDVSNILGREATGSMVVLTNGDIDKSQYRKFKIKTGGRPNDVGMHKEIMARRLKNNWLLPDLIIVDGGIAQARAAQFQIANFKLEIPVYGLAKRLEWLYSPNGKIVKLPRGSLSLKILQKLRDEAHRFAISYHRKLRSKSFLEK